MIEFKMPSLGADMENGTLVAWHVKPGDSVTRGDIIAEVETQKGVIEIEVWETGVVHEMLVPEGKEVPVGEVLALIAGLNEEEAKVPHVVQTSAPPKQPTPPVLELGPSHSKGFRASPMARKIAKQHGLELSKITGSGPHGAITRADVEQYIGQKTQLETTPGEGKTKAEEKKERTAKMRAAIATTMSQSKREIPHYYLQTEINMDAPLETLDRLNSGRSVKERLLPAALYIKAVAKACMQVPEMNGFWVDGGFHPSSTVNVGMGISLRQGGLVAPAIHSVEQKSVEEVMQELLPLVARARAGKLRSSEISDATITITNLGDQGVETVFGVIYPPQVAIVGFGRITEKPWAEGGMLGVKPVVTTTLAADHRASDGHRGGIFLNRIKENLATLM